NHQTDLPRARLPLTEFEHAARLHGLQRGQSQAYARTVLTVVDAVVHHLEHECVPGPLGGYQNTAGTGVLSRIKDGLRKDGLRKGLELGGYVVTPAYVDLDA